MPANFPRAASGVLLAAALAGCAAVPQTGPAPKMAHASDFASARSLAAPDADWPQTRWWDAYGDTQLSGLIDEALKNSPTLAQAEARFRSAAAQADVARGALLPTLAANGRVSETEQSLNLGYPPMFRPYLPKGFKSYGKATLDASWDLDLFGKNRAALAAQVSEAAASRADAAQARLMLSVSVAQAYSDLARLGAERDAAAQTVKDRELISGLVAQRLKNGIDTRAELKQAQAATPTSEADLEALDEQILLTRHRLAALLGAGPDRGLDIPMPVPGAVKPFGLPANLQADLIGRRPDIVAARLRLEAAAKRVDVAHAGFYPNINLAASIGQEALGLTYFTKSLSQTGVIGPAISLPIFEGGRLRAQYRGSKADYAAAVDGYNQTLAAALQDVADTLASLQSAQRQVAEREQALAAGEAAFDVAQRRYQGGLSNFVAVLSAEDAVIAQRRAAADARARAFSLDVALVRALGGGFHGT
jgi:NodT family efflux transporter outer membrane factor (OMF) lipoprotein